MSLFWQLSSLLPNGSDGKIRINGKRKVLEKEQKLNKTPENFTFRNNRLILERK